MSRGDDVAEDLSFIQIDELIFFVNLLWELDLEQGVLVDHL